MEKSELKFLITELIDNEGGLQVALIRLNRPQVLNALNTDLMCELAHLLESIDINSNVGCSIITGNEKAFAAGADIKEMAELTYVEMYLKDQFACWDRIRKVKKPIIAAVNGYALGGGCELAMLCDMIIASDDAKFGQPEINLGIIPGAGGTQRLTKAIGKAKAMEMILTGKIYTAQEMFNAGLITRVVPATQCLNEAISLAKEISQKPSIAIRLAKECILKSFDTTVEGGIEFERKCFYSLFATEDKSEGMKAFIEKRKPNWKHK